MNDELDHISIPVREYLWLKWFAQNADFGPADSDVKMAMQQYYEKNTGNRVPDDWKVEE
jgi:hypothetical protein